MKKTEEERKREDRDVEGDYMYLITYFQVAVLEPTVAFMDKDVTHMPLVFHEEYFQIYHRH